MLNVTIDTADFTKLSDVEKSHYKLGADGKYSLDLGPNTFTTDKDPKGLLSALESERSEHAKTKSKFDAIVKERDDAKTRAELAEAAKGNDVAAIQKMFEDKLAAREKQHEQEKREQQKAIEQQRQQAAEQLRITKATELANKLFGPNAPIMLPHVLNGLAPVAGENPGVAVLGADGKVDLTKDLSAYEQALLTNSLYKPMIVASKASGGSANEGTGNVPATRKPDGSARTYKDYKPGELMALKQSNPELFNQLKADHFKSVS